MLVEGPDAERSQPIRWGATGMAANDRHARLHIKDVVAAIQMTGAALAKCGGSLVEERFIVGYALHGENDSIPVAHGCDHACGHGGFCDLRTSLGPILGRSLLRRLG